MYTWSCTNIRIYVLTFFIAIKLVDYVASQNTTTLTTKDVLTSGYPSPFARGVYHYDVTIDPANKKAQYVVAIFDEFDINNGDVSKKPLKEINRLNIHDVQDENLGEYSDYSPNGVVAKIGPDRTKSQLKIIFVAVHPGGAKGFKIHFQLMTYDELVTNTSFGGIRGTVQSPGYPFNYPNDFTEIYRVSTTNSLGVIRFRFTDIRLGENTVIKMYDGNRVASEKLVYSFPEDYKPKTNWNYFMVTNTMTILFQSPRENTDRGFNLTYIEYCEYNSKDTPCDGIPELSFVYNLIIVAAGTGALFLLVLVISLICLCSRRWKERRQRNMGMERFE